MKRIAITLMANLLMAFPMFSYSPIIEPDISFLPALLDSTCAFDWDSERGVFVGNGGDAHSYDKNGNLIESVVYSCNWETREWERSSRHAYSYDSERNLTEETRFNWDADLGEWIYSPYSDFIGPTRASYTYDAYGNLASELNYSTNPDINELWKVDSTVHFYEFDNQIAVVKFSWDSYKKDWVRNDSLCFSYDTFGNLTESIYGWHWQIDSDNWEIYDHGSITKYTYDAYGNLIQKGSARWTGVVWDWAHEDRCTYFYDEYGNLTEKIEDWIGVNLHSIYTYDSNSNLIAELYCDMGEFDNWEKRDSIIYSYDENDNIVLEIQYRFHSNNGWVNHQKTNYEYDSNGNLTLCNKFLWDRNKWNNNEIFEAYWSELSTNIDAIKDRSNFKFYPNPTTKLLTIETGYSDHYSVYITTLNGQLILSREMDGTTNQIDLSSFESGVYFITIRSKDFVTTRKIIKL